MAKQNKKRIPRKKITVPKSCYFCKEEKAPTYADSATLRKFITDRGKIVARTRNGLCAKHQRRVTSSIKHARHLALLPFVDQG
jgi:small subunit ribosomal protein S18